MHLHHPHHVLRPIGWDDARSAELAALGDPALRLGRLRRALALAAQGGTAAAVALTKADLAEDPDGVRRAVAAAAPGVPVLLVGAREAAGVDEVAALAAPDRTLALLGESGAGKTTLTNALTGIDRATGAVRAGDAKGRHVTTSRELLPLPGGGAIVDTPGLRELGVAAGALDAAFPEVAELASGCRYRDCRHAGEPGCAVRAAAAAGLIAPERVSARDALRREAESLELRMDARGRRQAERRFGRQAREAVRERRRRRGGEG